MTSPSFQTLQKAFSDTLESGFRGLAIDQLKGDFQSLAGSDADKKAALDQSFRDVLVRELLEKDLNVDLVEKFISFSVLACRNDMVTTTMPVVLLGDVFDAVTLDQCEQMFTYVERNVSVWKEEIFFVACKNNLLRMCNDLLRRLSRSQNTVFCGRILLFLAKFFPFSERSGLNIVSEFNLENLTEYGSDGKEMGGEVTMATTATPTTTTENNPEEAPLQIDFNLYCKFWALQDFFRNPNQCYTAAQWKTFSTYSGNVLSAFNSFKLEEHRQHGSKRDKKRETNAAAAAAATSMDVDATPEAVVTEAHHFFAKFLTNPKLLSLQLSDSNFRRSVLVQFLILFQYLTSQVKFKSESLALTPAQSDWIKETEATVFQLLEETPPQGKKFCASVRHILQREELWNNWKNDGCKEFKKPDLVDVVSPRKLPNRRPKRLLGDLIRDAAKNNKYFMGNAELTKLWNVCPDNLLSCKGAERNFMPNLETYMETTAAEKSDASYEWRALRLLARQSPYFFVANTPSSSSNKVSDYLENVRKRIAKDRSEGATVKAEVGEEESVEMEDRETLYEEQDLSKAEQLTPDQDQNSKEQPPPVHVKPTEEQMKELSCVIANEWKRLGLKLGFGSDEVLFFESENATVADQCQAMLRIWFDDDIDASWDNLAYTLEGLKMGVAAEVVKKFIPNRVEDVSE